MIRIFIEVDLYPDVGPQKYRLEAVRRLLEPIGQVHIGAAQYDTLAQIRARNEEMPGKKMPPRRRKDR